MIMQTWPGFRPRSPGRSPREYQNLPPPDRGEGKASETRRSGNPSAAQGDDLPAFELVLLPSV